MNNFQEIVHKIKDKDNFILLGHIDIDGDCVGSLFAMKWILDKLNKNSLILIHEKPDDYNFINISDSDYKLFKEFNKGILKENDYNVIALDAGDKKRLGEGKNIIDSLPSFNIDHHIDNTEYADYNYVNPNKAATAIIIYDFANKLNINIDKKIGEAIILGIIADTGSFSYSNTSYRVLNIAAELMKKNIDMYKINRKLYSQNSYESVLFKGLALSSIEISDCGKIAWVSATNKMFEKANMDKHDSMGIVNHARDIKGVEVGISFTEKEEEIKVSFRSNEYCSVNKIAAKFNGGGHPRAAGCTLKKNLSDAISMILQEVEKHV